MNRIIKSPTQVKEKIEGWYLRNQLREKDQVDGNEMFTLCSKLSSANSSKLNNAAELHQFEIPVLVLFVGDEGLIVNTTERFIRVSNLDTETMQYSDFNCHTGFASIRGKLVNSKSGGIKSEGDFQEFGIKSKSGMIVYWTVPTGKPGFSFWNVTNRCEVIGRRFLIKYD